MRKPLLSLFWGHYGILDMISLNFFLKNIITMFLNFAFVNLIKMLTFGIISLIWPLNA